MLIAVSSFGESLRRVIPHRPRRRLVLTTHSKNQSGFSNFFLKR